MLASKAASTSGPPAAPEPGCRLCGARLHRSLLDLGDQPAATHSRAVGEVELRYPLHVRLCDDCGLAQVAETLSSEPRPAQPGAAEPGPPGAGLAESGSPLPLGPAGSVSRVGRYAAVLRERFRLGSDSLVIDVGAPDGGLLGQFVAAGIPGRHLPADPGRFDTETAMGVAVRHGCADIVLAHDVLPRAPDLFEFAAALGCILRPNGVLSLQFPHLLALIQRLQFDAFRHDIYTYLSLPVTERLLRSVGLRVFDAERVPDDGGALRVHACHAHSPRTARPGLKAARLAETLATADRPGLYGEFSARVGVAQDDIRTFLRVRREANRHVAAFGATARGAMLLNACGITVAEVAYVADPDASQHGRLLPGSLIPIVPLQRLVEEPPDDLLILPWPQAHDVINRMPGLRQSGAQLWTVLPRIARV